ncbi:MAG: apolipoprotein N-acyltransferase [Actinomycetota bacterium]
MTPETWRLRWRLCAAVLSGGLLLLAFPPVDVRFVAWIALVPLALAVRGATARAGALAGLAAGAAFFGGVLYWIASFGFLAWGALLALMVVFWTLFGWFAAWSSHSFAGRIAGIPLLFGALELARSRFPLGGFAWGLLGSTQHDGLPLLPVARVGGVVLLGVVVMLINTAIAEVIAAPGIWRRAAAIVVVAAAVAGPALIPFGGAGAATGTLDVAAIQVDVGEGTFGPHRGERIGPEDIKILDGFIGASRALSSDPPDLVVWPENALDRDPFADPGLMSQISSTVQEVDRPFLVGAILDANGRHFRNSLLLFGASGTVDDRYDKQQLVPFGEYVPWPSLRRVIPALDQIPYDGLPGSRPVIFSAGGTKIGGVICFESIFPNLVRDFVNKGAQLIVVATNNASFGRSTVSREHLAMSQIRAVEEGRTVLHAAISGISAIVDAKGRVSQKTGLFRDAVIRADVPLYDGRTPYGRFGDAIELGIAAAALAVAVAGIAGVFGRRRDRREVVAAEEFDWGPPVDSLAPEPSDAGPDAP